MDSTNHAFARTCAPLETDILEWGIAARAICNTLSEITRGIIYQSRWSPFIREVPESR